jgi:hypothetical protein
MLAASLWLGTLIACAIAGAPLLAHPRYAWLGRTARVVLAGGVGATIVSLSMTLLAIVHLAWTPWRLGALTALLALLPRVLIGRDPPWPLAAASPVALVLRLPALLILTAACAAALAGTAAAAATSVDLLLFWGPKAAHFAAVRTIDPAFLGDASLVYMHTSYPPLLTNLFALATMSAGHLPWGAAGLTYPLTLIALAAALPGVLGAARARYGVSALVIAIIACSGTPLRMAGNADMPMLFFEITSMGLLMGAMADDPAVQLLGGILLAGAASTKVEGLPFALAAGVAGAVLSSGSRWRAALRLLGPSIVTVGAWFAYGSTQHLFWGYRGYGRFVEVYWDRLGLVLGAINEALGRVGGGLPFLLPILLLIAVPPTTLRAAIPVLVSAVLTTLFVFTYLHGEIDPRLWIEWSAGRIFLTVPVLLALSTLRAAEVINGMRPGRVRPPGPAHAHAADLGDQ